MTWPVVTGWPARPRARRPCPRAAPAPRSPSSSPRRCRSPGPPRPRRRRRPRPTSTVPCIGETTASLPAPAAPARARSRRRRASSRHGGSGSSSRTSKRRPSTSTVRARSIAPPAAMRTGRSRPAVELRRPRGELVRLDEPVAGLALDEALVREQRLVEAEQRLRALDHELVERAQHPPPRVLAVDAVHDELRDHRVVERRRPRSPRATPGVDADARPRRLAVAR